MGHFSLPALFFLYSGDAVDERGALCLPERCEVYSSL